MSPLWIVLTLLPLLGSAGRFDCRGRILGAYYADAKSGCKAFHVCVRVAGGGIRDFRFFCPPGTLFHQEAQTCTDWGDDDPLACPADLYDGQFDLYKIGSGYDTKKLSSPGNREEESDFGLQRADTGDRRLAQNNAQSTGPVSDLRAAHSSDFFSGQRDRGRDEVASRPPQQQPAQTAQTAPPRQSFRRPTTQRTTPSTTQYTTTQPPPPPHLLNVPQYNAPSQRKLVRKRPVYQTTPAPVSPFVQNTQRQQFPEQQSQQPQQNYNERVAQSRQTPTLPANVPPQYKDEYVEVSRVTPKQPRYYNTNSSPTPFVQTTSTPKLHKKEGLVELYNYEAQSTPGFNVQKENKPFKIRNSFNVAEIPKDDFTRINPKENVEINSNGGNVGRGTPTTADYNSPKSFPTSTPSHRNFNSVAYEPEKNNFVPFGGAKQNYYASTTTISTTTSTTTSRPVAPANLNSIAYNTNIGFNLQASNFADGDEDDGQYRLPAGEDDGQYRPELYERELLSGAHSLNIAASGNRLPEDQKQNHVKQVKTQSPKAVSQSGVPRPFRPSPTPTSPPQTRAPEPVTYTTTTKPQTVNTQRTFDYYQTYTTTSRPAPVVPEQQNFLPKQNFLPINNQPVRQTTTSVPLTRVTSPSSPQPTHPPRPPTTRQPQFANPPKSKEDASYDYAYYDSDPGFSEYDHIEEFGKTKTKKA